MTDSPNSIKPVYLQGNLRDGGPIFVGDVGAIEVLIRPTDGRPSVSVEASGTLPGEIVVVHDSRGHFVRLEGEVRDPSRLKRASGATPRLVVDVNDEANVMLIPQTPSAINEHVPKVTVAAGVAGPVAMVVEAGQRVDLSAATGPVRIGAVVSSQRGDRTFRSAYVSLMEDRWLNLGAMVFEAGAALGNPVRQINYVFDGRQLVSDSVRVLRPEGEEHATFRRPVAAFAESVSTQELDSMTAGFGLSQ